MVVNGLSEIYYDANGNELHVGDAVRAVPDVSSSLWISGLEYGIITEFYGFDMDLCRIDMKEFQTKRDNYKRGVRTASCRNVLNINDTVYDVTPSSSLLHCLNCI